MSQHLSNSLQAISDSVEDIRRDTEHLEQQNRELRARVEILEAERDAALNFIEEMTKLSVFEFRRWREGVKKDENNS